MNVISFFNFEKYTILKMTLKYLLILITEAATACAL